MAWCGHSTKSKWKLGRSQQGGEKIRKKETNKLEYFLGDTEELIDSGDFKEMAIVCKRTDKMLDQLNDLMSQM